uniref:Uncharacterized protein n=1 Tax=Lactuca sativa TaxID=4236 RepID=A0A9R1UTS9_LACSA|nr:hypothetical protein LSAT_V11C800437880 [Lactuca sativa]
MEKLADQLRIESIIGDRRRCESIIGNEEEIDHQFIFIVILGLLLQFSVGEKERIVEGSCVTMPPTTSKSNVNQQQTRNLLELPNIVTTNILHGISAFNILENA